MANLYANVMQLSRDADIKLVFDMVGAQAAAIMGVEHNLAIGGPADIVILDTPDLYGAVRSSALALAGWKNGIQTFVRPRAQLLGGPTITSQ